MRGLTFVMASLVKKRENCDVGNIPADTELIMDQKLQKISGQYNVNRRKFPPCFNGFLSRNMSEPIYLLKFTRKRGVINADLNFHLLILLLFCHRIF